MKFPAILALVGLSACAATSPGHAHFPRAQTLLEQSAARHPELVRLTLHAIPRGQTQSRVIASTVPSKLDDWSDPEDLEVLKTHQPIVLWEGANLDYTAPILDARGQAIATTGVTVSGTSRPAQLALARQIAGEIAAVVLASTEPLW